MTEIPLVRVSSDKDFIWIALRQYAEEFPVAGVENLSFVDERVNKCTLRAGAMLYNVYRNCCHSRIGQFQRRSALGGEELHYFLYGLALSAGQGRTASGPSGKEAGLLVLSRA
ncbi:hypothetical protein ACUY2G_12760 [Corynebacterium guaraldiae]|uniref:hypothetical protein n=1 Tax=unclassified Corynebacterium TaxID=2624378 RepID=UPI00114CB775|nr:MULTISPECIES: hypothetical protein [unclassified Corynebacterium]MDK8896443.1 hypothetical protein [Corynebacterium sp. MSK004]